MVELLRRGVLIDIIAPATGLLLLSAKQSFLKKFNSFNNN